MFMFVSSILHMFYLHLLNFHGKFIGKYTNRPMEESSWPQTEVEILDGSERLSHHLMSKALQVSQPGGTGGKCLVSTCYFRGVLGGSCGFKMDAE